MLLSHFSFIPGCLSSASLWFGGLVVVSNQNETVRETRKHERDENFLCVCVLFFFFCFVVFSSRLSLGLVLLYVVSAETAVFQNEEEDGEEEEEKTFSLSLLWQGNPLLKSLFR